MTNETYLLSTEYGSTYFKELYSTTLTVTHYIDTAQTYDSVEDAYEQRDVLLSLLGIKFNVIRITTTKEIVDHQCDVIGGV